jgi:hypothetical protein
MENVVGKRRVDQIFFSEPAPEKVLKIPDFPKTAFTNASGIGPAAEFQ